MPAATTVSAGGFRVEVPATPGASTARTGLGVPRPAPSAGSWATCPTCDGSGDICATCNGSGVTFTPRPASSDQSTDQPPRKATVTTKKAPAKKPAKTKAEPEVTPVPVESITRGQLVRWNTGDLLDPEEATDEESWWPVPDGVWRKVLSVNDETDTYGQRRLVVEYDTSEHNDDYDERTYAPGTVLPTRPPTYRTLKIGTGLSVGDRLVIAGQEWVVHADGLEQTQ